MIKECKKCGSKNLYLELRVKGQDILSADMVALKCKDCGAWIKWCPKDERKYYYHNTIKKDKWQKLKEWLEEVSKILDKTYACIVRHNGSLLLDEWYKGMVAKEILEKMQELEVEDE